MYQALSAAELLADVPDAALRETRDAIPASRLADYADGVRRAQRPARAVQRAIEFVSGRDDLMTRCTRAIARAPRFADALAAVTADIPPLRVLRGAAHASLGGALIATRAGSRA